MDYTWLAGQVNHLSHFFDVRHFIAAVMANGSTQRDFHHPYQPYEIQEQFMNAVYDCLEQGKVGIFESPTGE